MAKRPTIEAFKESVLKDPDSKERYEAMGPEFELVRAFIKARIKSKLSQVELAKRLKSQQPVIARFEKGGYGNASIASLSKVANALGYSLKISLQAKKRG